MKNVLKITAFTLFLVFGVAFTAPTEAKALFLDSLFEDAPFGPHCLLMDCDDDNNNYNYVPQEPQVIHNTVNSNNTNSFNTSSIGTQYNNTSSGTQTIANTPSAPYTPPAVTTTPVTQPVTNTNTNTNYNYNTTVPTPVYYATQPVTPVYYPPSTPYYPPTYYPPTQPVQYPLSVSCSANTSYAQAGSYVTWSAYVSGGAGHSYTYRWSGTDGLYGTSNSVSTYYHTPGTKYAYITVYSAYGQQASAQCSTTVSAGTYYTQPVAYTQPVYTQPVSYTSGLQIACAADTTSTRVGVPVTWSAEATGGGYSSGFSYSWSGSEGLYGSQSSAVTRYYAPGTKTARVTVVAPNGQSQTRTCRNTVYVKSNTVAQVTKPSPTPSPTPTPQQIVVLPPPQPETVSAASLFSLGNVPWGWVGVLVVLVLIGIIFYLAFNRKKI